jgi:peptidyl-prolyl cis-trans isomerase C
MDLIEAGRSKRSAELASVLVLTLTGLAACGRHQQTNSQVVARVNNGEITVSQLNQALNAADPETVTPQITQKAIDSLVNEELLVQSAITNRLDRDPAAVAAIEHARRQILAEVYAERLVYPKGPISLQEEEQYYRQNPGLFERRKLYQLAAYTIKRSDMSDMLSKDLDSTHSSDQVRDMLDKHQIKYQTQHLHSAAEDLPIEKVGAFAAANVGDVLISDHTDGSVTLISVVGLEDNPLSFEAAKPAIAEFLRKKRNVAALEEHLKVERAAAKIAYLGQFARLGPPAQK